ncbi:MAG: Organic solvent tolerance protein [Proteobacteria bacterium]|nr:Organic solvent tolerance protein [Pseudomonadota bacterium]
MTGFARRPLAVFVCCLFAGIQAGHAAPDMAPQQLPEGEAGRRPAAEPGNDVAPLKLRLERKFNVLGRKKAPLVRGVGIENPVQLKKDDSYPLFVIADSIQGRAEEVTEAEGAVEMRSAGSLLFADKLTHRPLADEIEAEGNVRLLQDGTEIETPHLRMKLAEQLGFAEQADYHIVKQVASKYYQPQQTVVSVASSSAASSGAPMMLNVPNSYGLPTVVPQRRPSEAAGHAERVDFEGEKQVRLSNATYSTCKPGQADWYLRAAEVHLDYERNEGDASNASLWFKGVPMFYTPVASFSLNGQAHSGFLHPYFSTSTKNGFDIAFPYYWAIAPNYDATFYPRYMSKRGFQLGAEARYLDKYSQATTRLEYMPNDEIEQQRRYAYSLQYQQMLGRGFSTAVNWNAVSDDLYWTDLSSRLLQTSQTQLAQQVALNYTPLPELQSSIQVLRYQTLQPDPANPIARPYFLEPQINLSGFKANVLKTDLSMVAQYSRFTHPDKVDGDRLLFYPQVSLPIINSAFQIIPKFGLHITQYSLSQQTAGEPTSISRTLPTFTLDTTATFERDSNWLDTRYIQTLEPRLYYVNIPYRDQSKIPLFDTALSDFNFAQIFSENRYSGYDRINDANQLTAALTTRFLDANTGVERFKAMIGQRYYFKPQQVSIAGETVRSDNFSHLVAAVNGLVWPKVYADAAWEFNYREGVNDALALGMRYQPELGKVVSASYRYTRDQLTGASTVDQFDLAGQWPINSRWYVVGRYNYSLRDNKLLEAIAGFEYNAGCWATRFVAQQLGATSGSANTTYYFQLELNDLGSIGANPIGMLRRTIPGYGKTNELPNSSQLISQ